MAVNLCTFIRFISTAACVLLIDTLECFGRTTMCRRLCQFLRGDDAATAVEYAVMLALVLLAVLAAVITLGQNTNQSWNTSNTKLNAVQFGS